ncbi:MAG TPA: hypothetical protein VLW85_22580 [Myxococcales bacterium]|nr:hypothetical protein [Myxococcales bacterium]
MLPKLVRAGLFTGLCDAIWAVVLTLAYGRSIARLWQGVASVPFGPRMLEMGAAGVAAGLAVHFCVAFAWSAVLLLLLRQWPRLRQLHPAALGAAFGPLVWIAMSLAIIPIVTRQLPALSWRWWVQLAGHAVFVGQPMAWSLRGE